MMTTRELVPTELVKLNRAWEMYLDTSSNSTKPAILKEAWAVYNQRLRELGIIPTLTGYRVKNVA